MMILRPSGFGRAAREADVGNMLSERLNAKATRAFFQGPDSIMKKETARVIVDMMQDITSRLNNSIYFVMEGADEDEVQRYKIVIGQAMGGIFFDIKSRFLSNIQT
jgi:hypothetical protein